MKKKIALVIVLVIVLVGLGFAYTAWRNSKPLEVARDCATGVTSIAYTTQRSFLPACVKVASGTTITYYNQSDKTLEVGADPHPIHNGNKEVSDGKFTLDIEPGRSATTTFTQKGTFGLHDHKNSSARAVVVVE